MLRISDKGVHDDNIRTCRGDGCIEAVDAGISHLAKRLIEELNRRCSVSFTGVVTENVEISASSFMPLYLYDTTNTKEIAITYDLASPEHVTNSLTLLGIEGLNSHPLLKRPSTVKRNVSTDEEKDDHAETPAGEGVKDYRQIGINHFLKTAGTRSIRRQSHSN